MAYLEVHLTRELYHDRMAVRTLPLPVIMQDLAVLDVEAKVRRERADEARRRQRQRSRRR